MMSILKKFKINIATYFLILTFLFTGLIKNIILIYLIVIVHEVGHILIIKLLKYQIIKVEIYPMGGVTLVDKKVNTKIKHELLIASFGVIMQILLGIVFYSFFKNNLINYNTYLLFNNYNKTIILFNLLPIIPLDGYHILNSLVEIFLPFKYAFKGCFIVSLVCLIIFMFFNGVNSLNNYLIFSFLIFKIYQEYKDFKFRHLKFLLERFINNIPYNKIKYNKNINLNLLKKDTYHYFKKDGYVYSEKKILSKKFDNY